MILSESDIRKAVKEALRFRKPSSGYSRGGVSGMGGSSDFDYETGNTKIGSRVKWGPGEGGEKRKLAWAFLSQHLPDGSMLTSCYRSQEDQERIIKNYAEKNNYKGDKNDFDAMHAFIKSKGLVVARRIGKGHGGKQNTGAFDVSGADLDAIWEGVEAANNDSDRIAKFQKLKQGSIIERENNAVHIEFKLRNVDLSKKDLLAKKTEKQGVATSNDSESSADGSNQPKVVKRSDAPIKDGITEEEFLASRISIDSGENKGSYAQIIDDGRVFKRVKNGPPVFAGTDYTYKRARNEEEIKKIMASV